MIFLGVPPEAVKHTDLLRRAKPQVFTEEDGNAILNIAKRGFQMKFFCLASASSAFYFATPFIPILPPLLTKAAAFFLTYRCLSIPVLIRVEKQLKEISTKYDLENKPEFILTEEEMRALWQKARQRSSGKAEKKENEDQSEEGKKEKEAEVEGEKKEKEEKVASSPTSPDSSTETTSDSKPKTP